MKERWPDWIGRLAPARSTQVWRAVAEGWLRLGNARAPELWQALEAVEDPTEILAFAPAGLGAMPLEAPAEILLRLEALLPDFQDRQHAGATLLGELARRHPEQACAAWKEWSTRSPLLWSTELIDRGHEVLGRLEPQRIEEIAASIEDPAARTALRVVALEARHTSEAASAARAELQSIQDSPEKLHWSLRYLQTLPPGPRDEVRRQVAAAGRYLHAVRFDTEIRDVARWLDLVARFLPDQAESQLDCVLWSPAFTAESALALADAATQAAVPSLLLDRAETCAAALATTEAEGFVLRRELLIRAACRLCELTRHVDDLPRVTRRLLPEEEDELRARLAPRLEILPKDGPRLAQEVCAGIADRRLRLATLLRSVPQASAEALAPARLYESIARVDALADERLGLAALQETPTDPRDLLQRFVLPIRTPRIRTRALLRLTRHALAFEAVSRSRPDLLAPLEFVRWLLTTETDEELAGLTPDIAALGSAPGGARSTAEVQEAARQLAALESVAWPIRREALEELLARVASGLLSARRAGAALAGMARLPAQLRPEAARQALGRRWPEILPLLIATADTLPQGDLRGLSLGIREGLRALSPDAAQQRIFALCLTSAEERARAGDSLEEGVDGSVLEALAYLLAKPCPGRVPEVVRRLQSPAREELAVRLLRHGWLPEEARRELCSCVMESAAGGEAEIWCGPSGGDETGWTERAALWMAQAAPDPADPSFEPLLARLWRAPDAWRRALATHLTEALRGGGRPRGEALLRAWLHAHLAPTPGRGRPQGREDAARAETPPWAGARPPGRAASEGPGVSADRHALRAAEVWRRQRPTGRGMSGRRFWNNMTFETAASLVGAVFLILQIALEPALWWSWPPWRGSRELFGRAALGLLTLAPVSGVLLERYLTHRTPPRVSLRPGARLALWLLGSLPLAVFFLIPVARRWMDSTSARVLRPVVARLDLDAPPARLPGSSSWHWAFASGAFGIWLAATGVLLPLAGCFWLAAGGERKVILAACAALHLAQAGCLAIYAESDLRFTHPSRRYLRLAPWLCLLPQPAPFLAMAPVIWAGAEAPHQRTLTWSAYARAGNVRRHSQWLDLRLALQQRWQAGSWIERWSRPQGLELPQRDGRAEAARRTWMRAKALLLPVEASLAIGWLIVLIGPGPEPDYDPIGDPALGPWLLATSLLATLGLLQAAAGSLARLLRLRRPALLGPPAAGLYLLITQAALAFGLLAGPLAAHGRFGVLAMLTVFSGILAMGFSFLLMALSSLPASRPGTLADSITWPLSLLLIGFLPLPLALLPGKATIVISAFTLLTLLGDVLLGLRYIPWILYPFTLRRLFDRRLGLGSRASLVFRALTALLPLGGLALPCWMWARRGETPEAFVE